MAKPTDKTEIRDLRAPTSWGYQKVPEGYNSGPHERTPRAPSPAVSQRPTTAAKPSDVSEGGEAPAEAKKAPRFATLREYRDAYMADEISAEEMRRAYDEAPAEKRLNTTREVQRDTLKLLTPEARRRVIDSADPGDFQAFGQAVMDEYYTQVTKRPVPPVIFTGDDFAFNMIQMTDDLALAKYHERIVKEGEPQDQDVMDEWKRQAKRAAEREMTSLQLLGTGRKFARVDYHDKLKAYAEAEVPEKVKDRGVTDLFHQNPVTKAIGAVLVPRTDLVHQGTMTREEASFQFGGGGAALNSWGRMVGSTFLGAYIDMTPKELLLEKLAWGTPALILGLASLGKTEQIRKAITGEYSEIWEDLSSVEGVRALSGGGDIISAAPKLGDAIRDSKLATAATLGPNSYLADTLGDSGVGLLAAAPVVFFEPDVISMGLFGAGKADKLRTAAKIAMRHKRVKKTIQTIRELKDAGQFTDALRAASGDPVMAALLHSIVGTKILKDDSVPKAVDDLLHRANLLEADAIEKLEKITEVADKGIEAYDEGVLLQRQKEAAAEAGEALHQAAQIRLAAAEAEVASQTSRLVALADLRKALPRGAKTPAGVEKIDSEMRSITAKIGASIRRIGRLAPRGASAEEIAAGAARRVEGLEGELERAAVEAYRTQSGDLLEMGKDGVWRLAGAEISNERAGELLRKAVKQTTVTRGADAIKEELREVKNLEHLYSLLREKTALRLSAQVVLDEQAMRQSLKGMKAMLPGLRQGVSDAAKASVRAAKGFDASINKASKATIKYGRKAAEEMSEFDTLIQDAADIRTLVQRSFTEAVDELDDEFDRFARLYEIKDTYSRPTLPVAKLPEKFLSRIFVGMDEAAGTVTVDLDALRQVVSHIPDRIVEAYIRKGENIGRAGERIGERSAQEGATAAWEFARILRDAGPGRQVVDLDTATEIQRVIGQFESAIPHLNIETARVQLPEQYWTAIVNDAGLPLAPNALSRFFFGQSVKRAIRQLTALLSPKRSKYGEYSDELVSVFHGVINSLDQFKSDIIRITVHNRGDEHKILEEVMGVMDDTVPRITAGGARFVNMDPISNWERGRAYLLGAFAVADDLEIADIASRNEVWAGALLKDPFLAAVLKMWTPRGVEVTPSKNLAKVLKALQAALGEETMTWTGLTEVIKRLTRRLHQPDENQSRSILSGTMALMGAASMYDAQIAMARVVGGSITREQALAYNALLRREWGTAGLSVDGGLQEILGLFTKLGAPFTKTEFTRAGTATTTELVEISKTDLGSFIIPRPLLDAMDAALGTTSKQLKPWDEAYTGPKALLRPFYKLLGTWKASVTVGLLIPRPAYLIGNVGIGDLSQVAMFLGPYKAAQIGFQNLPSALPFYGRFIQGAHARAVSKITAEGKTPLASAWAAFFNPELNRLFAGQDLDGFVRFGDGSIVKRRALIKEMEASGIFETAVHEELLSSMELHGTTGWFAGLRDIARTNAQHAELFQQKQRAATYLQLRFDGHSAKEAAELTKKALYDWKHGFAQLEASALLAINIPFYRFWRLSLAQAVNVMLEPLVKPGPDFLKKAAIGQTKLARARQHVLAAQAIPFWMHEGEFNERDEMEGQEEADLLLGLWKPSWAGDRLGVAEPIDEARRDYYREKEGRAPSHVFHAGPYATTLSSFAWWANVIGGMTALGVAASSDEYVKNIDNGRVVLEGFLQLGGPTFDLFEEFLKADKAPEDLRGYMAINAGEAVVLDTLASTPTGVFEWMKPLRNENIGGRVVAPKYAVLIARLAPFLLQLPDWVRAVDNPEFAESYSKGISTFFLHTLGIKKTYAFDPDKQEEYRQRDILEAARQRVIDAETITLEPGTYAIPGISKRRRR